MSKKSKDTLKKEYFEDVYQANDDPWNFETSEYEAEKYETTLNSLPEETYENAFEIGCSIGVLTEMLAERCEKLLATDVSEKALAQAKRRCADLPHVKFKLMKFPEEFPAEKFDLILVSEVGYYLSPADWQTALEKIFDNLQKNGQVALVHWLPYVEDYPQTGDEVHDSFAEFAFGKFKNIKQIRREKYRLDVWRKI